MLAFAPAAGLVIALAGCAGLDVQSANTSEEDSKALGFRYYESSPYLLVYTNNEGGLTSKIIHLPDETKKRSARPYSYLATNSVTLSFANGVLTNGVFDIDETAIPTAVISALEKAAGALIAGANTGKTEATQTVPAPYLFKIIIKDGSVTLVGDQPAEKDISFGGAQ